jgi:hypothetical protein
MLAEKAIQCTHCGASLDEETRPAPIDDKRSSIPECPICHSNGERAKLTTLFRGSQASGLFSRAENKTYSANIVLMTKIAGELGEPPDPNLSAQLPLAGYGADLFSWWGKLNLAFRFVFLSGVVLCWGALGLSKMARGDSEGSVYLLMGIGVVVFLVWSTSEAKRRKSAAKMGYERAKSAYENAISIWERLYYCFDDDVVYDPRKEETYDAAQLSKLIGYPPE